MTRDEILREFQTIASYEPEVEDIAPEPTDAAIIFTDGTFFDSLIVRQLLEFGQDSEADEMIVEIADILGDIELDRQDKIILIDEILVEGFEVVPSLEDICRMYISELYSIGLEEDEDKPESVEIEIEPLITDDMSDDERVELAGLEFGLDDELDWENAVIASSEEEYDNEEEYDDDEEYDDEEYDEDEDSISVDDEEIIATTDVLNSELYKEMRQAVDMYRSSLGTEITAPEEEDLL